MDLLENDANHRFAILSMVILMRFCLRGQQTNKQIRFQESKAHFLFGFKYFF
jgi:hypothetical protein